MKLIFLIYLLIFSLPAWAEEKITAVYQAYGAGLNLIAATMDYQSKNDDFQIQTTAQTKGALRFLLEAKSIFSTNGKIKNNQFVIDDSSFVALSKNKQKKRIVDLTNKPDFVDYQIAFLNMMALDNPHDKTFKVFDGKRELFISFKYHGEQTVPFHKNGIYVGPADYYTVTIEVTAGKKSGWFFNRINNRQSPALHVYFASVDSSRKKVMVYSAFDTALFGQIQIFLSQLDYKDTSNAINH